MLLEVCSRIKVFLAPMLSEDKWAVMGELIFIGLGLYDEQGLSLRGQAEARACDRVFAELYTSVMPGIRVERLGQIIGKPVEILSRTDVEEKAVDKILSKAKSERIAFLVAGDPMVATTHIDLRLRAQRAGIGTRIIHAASVASAAAGVTGLQSYKFGKTVTVPVSRGEGFPMSIYASIRVNFEAGLHSLVLLEVDVESKRHITIPEALEQFLALSARTPNCVIRPETLVVGVARLEAPDMIVKASTVSELMRFDFGKPPQCLIFPSVLHFVEAEALQVFCGARRNLVTGKQ
jgi:diphthine synthase